MLFLRYLFSIVFSFLIHSLAFSSAPPAKLLVDLDARQQSSIAIQLVAPVKVEKEPLVPIKEQQVTENAITKSAQKTVTETKQIEQKTSRKAVKKESIATEKPIEKNLNSKTNTDVETKKEALKKQKNEPQKVPQVPQQAEKKRAIATPQITKQSAPKIVEKITFSARPTPIAYPQSAKRRNIEGAVLVEVWLDEQGKQIKQHIINSSGHQILDKAALKGIRQWQFSRQQDDGQAIAYRVQVPINFGLK